ncbi:DNA gyrase inhibitor YacG [Marinobacterium aestuariivivens]|uniref:DNA gyrase inhibitor YacG n=1 Tax=Marinobacterium aestuariivivens TaxID=1698799 RepID=A0ABW1ZWJ8_9GAMM
MTRKSTAKTIKCPQCGKPSEWSQDNSNRPFCSERCRMIDLGAWASEEYQIPVDKSEDEYSTGLDEDERRFTPVRH